MSSPSFSLYAPLPPTTTSFFAPHQTAPPTPPPPPPPFSFSYLPQTPSPLRTSRNVNLMPPQPTPTAPTKSSPLSDISNVWNSATSDENAFTFSPSIATSTLTFTNRETPFPRRDRSQSPITELSTRTSLARDRRKSLFLEQIRSKREDEKFEGRGDAVLRMDWARGEAERKSMLARQAMRLGMLDTEMEWEDDAMDAVQAGKEEGPSPTEERELEELIRLHEEGLEETEIRAKAGEEDMMDELDDEDYDQLFMEISVSQEQQSQSHQQQELGTFWAQQDSAFAPGVAGIEGDLDEHMDIS